MRVLTVGDCHAPAMHRMYPRFLAAVKKKFRPHRVVMIGDVVDWHAISYHERIPSLAGAADEFKQAKKQVHRLANIFDDCPVDWLIGNHDALTHRQAASAGLPPEILRSYNEIWEVDWKVHERFGELVIDDVVYMHGEGQGGKYAHGNRAVMRGKSVVMGHLHSNAGVIPHANPDKLIFGCATGCGVDNARMQFLYGRACPRKPILGCATVDNGVPNFVPMKL